MSIEYRKEYINAIDEAFVNEAKTGNLGAPAEVVQAGQNAAEVKIPKISIDGPADYSRTSGYAEGAFTWEYETKKCDYDRGRKFTVDAVDNMDTANGIFANMMNRYVKEGEVKELDAWRFSKLANKDGVTTEEADITTEAALVNALTEAVTGMDEAEVPTSDRVLYITPTLMKIWKNRDNYKSTALLDSFAKVIEVPQTRFYTEIKLLNGTSVGEEKGGYEKAEDGKNINFMIVHEPSVIAYVKHHVPKVISPELNQQTDGWAFFTRTVALCDVYDNAVKGIYVHNATK